MTITITIGRSSVLSDIRVKSHAEAASISDAEERYIVEAGTEKLPEVHQCITDAFAEVSAFVRPFITGSASATANDAYRSSGDLALALDIPTRKSIALATPLADAIHKYVVDSAMNKFYRAVSRPAMGEPHAQSLASDKANIDVLLYTKQEPVY